MTDESSKLDEQQRTRVKLTEVSESTGEDFNNEKRDSFETSKGSRAPLDDSKPVAHGSIFGGDSPVISGGLNAGAGVDLSDDYEVLELIGQGGTGQFYKVRDKNSNRILAIKVLRKELVVDNQTVKRFNHEATAAAGLTHANVVSVYGHGEAKDGSPYITMNFIDGESLASILKRESKLEWQRALNLFVQICEGLDHAHAIGLVHRDLKPSNIIVSKTQSGDEVAHIVDFGIAKVIATRGDTLNTVTASGEFLGTPVYMSPEQCLGQNVDQRTDFYALGCMLFEAVSGKSPFAGASTVEVIAKKMSEQSPTLKTEDMPPALSMIVSCCMARHPQDRYESARAVQNDLEALTGNQSPKHARLKIGMDKSLAGKRLLAFCIDNVIVSSVSGVFNWFIAVPILVVFSYFAATNEALRDRSELSSQLMMVLIYAILPTISYILYTTYFEGSKRGTTPGKQLCGLDVCDLYGNKLSRSQALIRNLAKMALLVVLPITGLLGFFLPVHQWGIATTLLTVSCTILICARAWKLHHQTPWDIWMGTQIRRR
ncbi:MAG: protein kinase [Candidatus Melainabacteria bacterium]|nr:protein kinase [Candidatus Melainabacteria bacterium]